jgi:hypothetical protein
MFPHRWPTKKAHQLAQDQHLQGLANGIASILISFSQSLSDTPDSSDIVKLAIRPGLLMPKSSSGLKRLGKILASTSQLPVIRPEDADMGQGGGQQAARNRIVRSKQPAALCG